MKRSALPLDEPPPASRPGTRRNLAALAGWALCGGLCAAITSAFGYLLASLGPGPPITRVAADDLTATMAFCGSLGAITGLLIGTVAGFAVGKGQRITTGIALGVTGALTGAIGGLLSPYAIFQSGSALPAIASSALAWGVAGLLTGALAFPVSRWLNETGRPENDDEWQESQLISTSWQPASRNRNESPGPVVQALPMLAASVFALIAAAIAGSAQTSLVLLALGLLGLAQSHSLVHLNRRLSKLERRTQP